MYLHPIRILGLVFILLYQLNVMIPHRDMLVSFPAADTVRVKAHDMDCVRSEGDQTEKPKAVRLCLLVNEYSSKYL